MRPLCTTVAWTLARTTKLAPEILTELVQLADMARINGIGAVFGLMLEEMGIHDVEESGAA